MNTDLLNEACISSLRCEKETGIPAELTLSQWALESGWGSHSPGNNCFGIKGNPLNGQLLNTTEYFSTESQAEAWVAKLPGRQAIYEGGSKYACKDWFELFPTMLDCFNTHAQVFKGARYAEAFESYSQDRDINKLIDSIGPIYATDPNYVRTLKKILDMPEVSNTLAYARGEFS